MSTPLERATAVNQYDLEDNFWLKVGRSHSTLTDFYWEYLKPYSRLWKGKHILDVGAGTGWLVDYAVQLGAMRVVGIDPSARNVAQGKTDHPTIELYQGTLDTLDFSGARFDILLGIMSFPHIADIDAAFRTLRSLATDRAEIILVVSDFEYFKTPRHGYDIETQPIDDEQYAVAITRPNDGTIADIVRTTDVYQRAAEQAGFDLAEERAMTPTENQIARAPKYGAMRAVAITRLLRFVVR